MAAAASQFRATEPIRPKLRQQSGIYLEEQSYAHAIPLFHSILAASTSLPPSHPSPIPSPYILALLATVAVHPLTTSRAPSSEARDAADLALKYLHDLVETTGPHNANLARAFAFQASSSIDYGVSSERKLNRLQQLNRESESRQSTPRRATSRDHTSDEKGDDSDPWKDPGLDSKLAETVSLFRRADDFWDVVGWSFNCAVLHRNRWEHWREWLGLMVNALEHDLNDCCERLESEPQEAKLGLLHESLAGRYLQRHASAGLVGWRHVCRAIFADGSDTSVKAFTEIWKGEPRVLKSDENAKQEKEQHGGEKRKLDVEGGDFGDYEDEADDDEAEDASPWRSRTPRSRRKPKRKSSLYAAVSATEDRSDDQSGSIDSHGGAEAFALRRRLLAVAVEYLAAAESLTPHGATAFRPTDLLDAAAGFIRPQPSDLFQLWITPHAPAADAARIYTLDDRLGELRVSLILPLLPVKAVAALGPRGAPIPPFDSHALQATLLPCAPATGAPRDAVKLSLLLESVLLGLWRDGALAKDGVPGLRSALEAGVAARQVAERPRKGGVKVKDEAGGQETRLDYSARRMHMILDGVEAAG